MRDGLIEDGNDAESGAAPLRMRAVGLEAQRRDAVEIDDHRLDVGHSRVFWAFEFRNKGLMISVCILG